MMSNNFPTYVREKGHVYAFFEGRIIAEGKDFAKVEETAVSYLDSLTKGREKKEHEAKVKNSDTIVTPNGVKGKILNRMDGLFGEKEITIRLENGRVAKFIAKGGEEYLNERTASTDSPIANLRKELDAEYGHDRVSLTARVASLNTIITNGKLLASQKTSSYADDTSLNGIILEATAERKEVETALDYLKQADEVAEPFAPFETHVVGQADMGRSSGDNWLDATAQDMISEVEGVNFDKMLVEEPGMFAAEQDTGTLANPESVATMALSHITAKTAAFVGTDVEAYREKFVAATQVAAQNELKAREAMESKKAKTVEASATEPTDDSQLFM